MGYKSEMQVLEVKVRSGVIYLKRPSESKLAQEVQNKKQVHKFVLKTQAKVIVNMIVATPIKVKSFNRQCALVFLQCFSYSQNRGHCESLFLNCQEDFLNLST
jgi:hypothetical protein